MQCGLSWPGARLKTPPGAPVSPRLLVLGLIVVTAAARIVFASAGGLGFDESYMVGNSHVFSLSYVDSPPLHVWLVAAWSWLTGSEYPLLLRLPFIALFAGSTWLMFRLTARLFGEGAGVWAALLFNLAPVFTIAHATWILPDGPLIFFMLATANILVRILFEEPPAQPILWWIAAGACAGLAGLSKYHGGFLVLATFAFLLTVADQRRRLATPGPWLGALTAIIVFSPAAIWNLRHGMVGFAFQADRLTSVAPSLRWLPQFVGGQFLYLTPWLIVPLAYFLGRALWRGPAAPKSWFLGLLAIGPIAFFTGAALFGKGLPHWPMPGWLFTFPLMGEAWVALQQRRPRFVRDSTVAAAAFLVLVAGVLVAQSANGAMNRIAPWLFAKQDPTLDLVDWSDLRTALTERNLINAETPAIAASYWMDAGKANYAVGRQVPVLCVCQNPEHFAYLHDQAAFVGRDLIVVGTKRFLTPRLAEVAARFQRLEPLAPVTIKRGGQPVLELQLFRGVDFRG